MSSPAETREALVTGTSSGIGEAVARHLLAQGWHVHGLDLAAPTLSDARFTPWRVDLAQGAAIEEVLDAVLRTSTPEALVHAAGLLRVGALGALDAQDGQAMWALHVAAATRLANRVLPLMRRARAGRVILIGSRVAGGMPGRSQYAASKAALLALAKSWAGECIADGVTVNVVSPAATDTPMLRDPSRAGTPPQVPPIGRLIQPDEVAALVTYLTGPHAQAITGQDWVICGGASVRTP